MNVNVITLRSECDVYLYVSLKVSSIGLVEVGILTTLGTILITLFLLQVGSGLLCSIYYVADTSIPLYERESILLD